MSGRPIFEKAMTNAQRKRRQRAKARAEREAVLKAIPPISEWMGEKLFSLNQLVEVLQPPQKPS